MNKVPYASTVTSLMYAMVYTRSDINHTVGVVSIVKEHWEVVKWLLRHLKGISRVCLCFGSEPMLVGCTDSDLTGDVDSRKSISRFLMKFTRELSLKNPSCKNVLHYPPQKLSTLLLLRVVRKFCR